MLEKGVCTFNKSKLESLTKLESCSVLIHRHRGVLSPSDAAAPNAVAAKEIHILGGGGRIVLPSWLYPCSHPLQAAMWNHREIVAKSVCQGPCISFFSPLLASLTSKVGKENILYTWESCHQKGQDKSGPGKKFPVPAEVREEQKISSRHSSTTSCHIISHEEEFPKELILVGEEGKRSEASVKGGRRKSLYHTQFSGPSQKRVNPTVLLVIPGIVSLLPSHVRFKHARLLKWGS